MHIVHNTKIIGIELNINRVGEAGGGSVGEMGEGGGEWVEDWVQSHGERGRGHTYLSLI